MVFRTQHITRAAIILAITALAFAVMFIFTPLSTDDFWYLTRSMGKWFAGQPLGFPLQDIFDEIRWRYFNDNGRLANVVFAFLIYAPHWFVASLSAMMCAWSLFSLARLSGVGRRDWKKAVWLCSMFAMALPWVEHLFTLCYSLNYVWAMAFSAWIVLRVLSARPLPLWAAAGAGLLFGAWHEGFSVPVFIGLGTLVVCMRRRFSAPWIWMLLAAMAVGILGLLLSPAFFSRRSPDMDSPVSLAMCVRVLSGDILYLAFCCLLLIAAFRKSARGKLASPLVLFVFVAGLVSLCIHLFASFGLRVGLCAEFFAIPGIMLLWPLVFSFPSKLSTLVTSLIGLLLFSHLLVSDACTIRLNRQYAVIYDQYRKSPDGRIFIELTPDFEAPLLALGKPLFLHMEPCLAVHLTAGNVGKPMLAVPVELSQVDACSGSSAPGRPGLRMLGNLFFIPADSLPFPRDCRTEFRASVLFGDTPRSRSLVAVPFVSDADSMPYFYIYVEDRMPLGRFAPLKGIDW